MNLHDVHTQLTHIGMTLIVVGFSIIVGFLALFVMIIMIRLMEGAPCDPHTIKAELHAAWAKNKARRHDHRT